MTGHELVATSGRRRLHTMLERLRAVASEWDAIDLTTNMSVVLILLFSGGDWYLRIPITILAAAALLLPGLNRKADYWFIVTVIMAAANVFDWYTIDNHKYLMTYWCLALFLSLLAEDPAKAIALNARLLIGLAFLFAVIWKLTSGDFVNGTFFHYLLLMDERFLNVSFFVGNMPLEMMADNFDAMGELFVYNSVLTSVQLQDVPRILTIARTLTVWTLVIESLVAIGFLWPEGKFISKWRDYPLLAFLLTTYAIAHVVGFGWLLISMGVAQSLARSRLVALAYVLVFFVLQVYLVPWEAIVLAIQSVLSG